MTRPLKIGLSILLIVAGWSIIGLAYTTPMGGHPTSTIMFLLAIGLFIGGVIGVATWTKR